MDVPQNIPLKLRITYKIINNTEVKYVRYIYIDSKIIE